MSKIVSCVFQSSPCDFLLVLCVSYGNFRVFFNRGCLQTHQDISPIISDFFHFAASSMFTCVWVAHEGSLDLRWPFAASLAWQQGQGP